MDDPFTETQLAIPTPFRQPGEVARGPDWYVTREGARHELHYLTGELPERDEWVEITEAEVGALRAKTLTLADLRARYFL